MSAENIATFLAAADQDPSLLDYDIRMRQFSITDRNLNFSTDARIMLAETLIEKARDTLREIVLGDESESSTLSSEEENTLKNKAYAGIILGVTTKVLTEMLQAKENTFDSERLCVLYGNTIRGLGLPYIMPSDLISHTSAEPIKIRNDQEYVDRKKLEKLENYYQKHQMVDFFAMGDNLPATLGMFLTHRSFMGTSIMKELKKMLPLFEKLSRYVHGESQPAQPTRRSQPAKAEAPQWLASVLDGIDFNF